MQKPQKDFPYYKEYQKKFPITKDTIFVFKDDIYSDNEIPYDIMYHEQEHLKSQKEIGAKKWIENYIEDKTFRLKEEKRAYLYQLQKVKELADRTELMNIFIECCQNISSPLYGSMISYREAEKYFKNNL